MTIVSTCSNRQTVKKFLKNHNRYVILIEYNVSKNTARSKNYVWKRKLDQIDYKGVIKTIWNTTAALLQQYFIKAGTKFDRIKGVTLLSVTRAWDTKKRNFKDCQRNRKFCCVKLWRIPGNLQMKFYLMASVELDGAASCLMD